MIVRFNPPQLEVARNSQTLCRLAEEMAPLDLPSEIRVLHPFPYNETRLVLIREGREPASLQLPGNWLYGSMPEAEIRHRLESLLGKVGKA